MLRTHSLLAPNFSSSRSGAGPAGAQVEEATSDSSGAKPKKQVIANGLSFGVGKELPL